MSWLSVTSFFISLFFNADIEPFHLAGETQGTTYQLTYYASNELVNKIQIDSILLKIDSSLSLYKPYSLISRFNRAEEGLTVDDHFVKVIRKSLQVYKRTDGLFDVTVQPLVQAWGFGPIKITHLPDSTTIRELLKCIGTNKIHLNGNSLSKDLSCIHIDLNGIAQGYSVDVLADFLEKSKIKTYIVEIGGEIRVKGRKPGGEKMNIGIESPAEETAGGHPVKTIVRMDKGAITTSGNYEKYYKSGSKTITHLINPKTGYPLQNEMVSVTVYAKDAITADGYDNALMGMGLEKAFAFVKRQRKMEAYFIYHKADGSISDTATVGFYRLMK
ncbi:MAG: FAD:protein FMN transferase [Sphingobacteriaceae bacterium]